MEELNEEGLSFIKESVKTVASQQLIIMELQIRALSLYFVQGTEHSMTFLYGYLFGLMATTSLGISLATLGVAIGILWIQIIGWIFVALSVGGVSFFWRKSSLLKGEKKARDEGLKQVEMMHQVLEELKGRL